MAWTKGMETEEDIDSDTISDHLNSNSSIRDRRARIVQLRLNLDSLPLDRIRLVGDR
jgi:hypothetical protein